MNTRHADFAYPHPGGCNGCRIDRVCNGCGTGVSINDRCTNGRCRVCHVKICVSKDEHMHGYGNVPVRLR